MPLPSAYSVLGLFVLLYLSTFFVFAVLRIITGVSIQRVGYLGLRRIAFSPRHGISLRVRGIGLSIHRPTFTQPTWISLNLSELQLIVDLQALGAAQPKAREQLTRPNGSAPKEESPNSAEDSKEEASANLAQKRGQTWRKLTALKEKVKLLHRRIHWLRLIDVNAIGTSVVIKDVATIRLERFALSVDTRAQTVDRTRMFQHHKATNENQRPAEWRVVVRSVQFTPDGKESTEIMDLCQLSAHGFLQDDVDGLRDASIALKTGRLTIPCDDIDRASKKARQLQKGEVSRPTDHVPTRVFLDKVVSELEEPGSKDAAIVRMVSDSKEFVGSFLRGIHEIQLAIGSLALSKHVSTAHTAGRNVCFNMAVKELGFHALRLDSRSPAHRMYFATQDVAHQVVVTATSMTAGVNDGHDHPERMLYIPMVTATVKTTLLSRTIQNADSLDPLDRNSNILFANLVCTSPSIDLDPKHLPLVIAIMRSRQAGKRLQKKQSAPSRHELMARLLPKVNIKFAIQEPVVRVSLPPSDISRTVLDGSGGIKHGRYDMIIASTSAIALDVEAQHELDGHDRYSLALKYRQTSQNLYGQTFTGERHDLLLIDTIEVNIDMDLVPELQIRIAGKFQTLSIYLVRPDIGEGLRQIIHALRKDPLLGGRVTDSADSANAAKSAKKPSFLRRLPDALQYVHLQGSDFSVDMAGVDTKVSKYGRGFSLQLSSCSTEYRAQRDEVYQKSSGRRSLSRSALRGRSGKSRSQSPATPPRKQTNKADGRRLTFHVQDLEGFIIDSRENSVADHFLGLPRFEVAFSTSSDQHGPVFHVNGHAKSLLFNYSLYNHFAIGVALMTLKKTFVSQTSDEHLLHTETSLKPSHSVPAGKEQREDHHISTNEIITIDFKASLIQVKVATPQEPHLMLQIHGLDVGRHRWANPFLRSRFARLYAATPDMQEVWSRVVSIMGIKVDIRDMKHKIGTYLKEEKSIDITTEAIRISVPHELIVHDIFDNFINMFKTVLQMSHHFKTGSDEYVLAKHPEGPKHMPKLNLRAQVFVFVIEDSAFEWKLGMIYRAGLVEQKQRNARAEAFKLKVKALDPRSQRGGNSRVKRAPSARSEQRDRSPSQNGHVGKRRGKSTHAKFADHHDRGRKGRAQLRYDAEGFCLLTSTCHRSVDQAQEKLDVFNAQSWKTRIDGAIDTQRRAMNTYRAMFWGAGEALEETEQDEPIMGMPQRPGLMSFVVTDLNVAIDKPSFPLSELPDFLHDIGKGMPRDMEYGLLVPMNLQVQMGEARVGLRDYPLPLLHVPAMRPGQSTKLPSLSLSTDFVVAEEFRDFESQRHINIVVVPEDKLGPDEGKKRFAIDVRRTISPVKTYSDIKIDINTSAPTRITWGTSYQPAIQDMMQVVEGFTKPALDPSDRVGFWDKIRMGMHSRVQTAYKGDGDFHLCFKGSRDPYVVTGHGAGFVMVWRNNVRWNIAQDPDPRKFMTVDSGDYILAIPDYNHYARAQHQSEDPNDPASSSTHSAATSALFKKVVMKLSGNVRWVAGLVFEQELKGDKRNFDFKPHYEVVLKHPDYAKAPEGEVYDGYRGFRSEHIHMSIAVAAPHTRDWNVSNLKPSDNYNSVHLTPRFFTHFYNWWHLFSGVMSLPVRQGPLWGSQEKSSKKFGRHLATLKYNLLLSPVFISHIYKHKDAEDYESDVVSATGLKMKLDSFMLDLHQRRETFELPGHGEAKPKKTSSMKMNQCQLDFISGDIRAVSASIRGTGSQDLEDADEETLAALQTAPTTVDMSKFTIPDNDFTWIDMDDFVELDWILPSESNPETNILPLAFTPRFTYIRQTDHGDTVNFDNTRSSPYGDEPTHFCVISAKNDPRRVQADLMEERLGELNEQILNNTRKIGEQELERVRHPEDKGTAEQYETLKTHGENLHRKHAFVSKALDTLRQRLEKENEDPAAMYDPEIADDVDLPKPRASDTDAKATLGEVPIIDRTSDFNNRFVVHNAQVKWNNSLRNIILRYIHQVSQRRGFVYYMSRRAVKFILDILDEQHHSGTKSSQGPERQASTTSEGLSPGRDDDMTIQDRIEQLLNDGRNFVNADDPGHEDELRSKSAAGAEATEDISTEYTAQNVYHFRLIAPQVQLQSEKSSKSVVLITAKGAQLKVVKIMDKDRVLDDISGLVQERYNATMDSLQMFVTSTKAFTQENLHMYSANRYGARAGTYWPPWLPHEVMYVFSINPYGFSRVVHRTSASLRYDKYNTLRLKYNEDVSAGQDGTSRDQDKAEHRMDHLWVEFPHFRAICDSEQYYAMYLIVTDLILYSEPLENARSERLEKIMLASDFSDLTGAPEMVVMLQERINQLEEIKTHFQINEKMLDRQGWKDRIALDQDLTNCEDELFFMMKAITTSQRKLEDRNLQDTSNGMVRTFIAAKEIAWHLIRDKGESLMEVQLREASYDRTDNSDGSNSSAIEFGRINAFNLLPNALYPQIIEPYVDEGRGFPDLHDTKMLRVRWLMLEAIAGIPVVDSFEVLLIPVRVQLEREVAKRIFEYVFPGVGGSAFEGSGIHPSAVKSKLASAKEDEKEGTGVPKDRKASTPKLLDTDDQDEHDPDPHGLGAGAGSLEKRLTPTYELHDGKSDSKTEPKNSLGKRLGLGIGSGSHTSLHGWSPFQHSNKSNSSVDRKTPTKKAASRSSMSLMSRSPSQSSPQRADTTSSLADSDKAKRGNGSDKKHGKDKDKDAAHSDDLTQMMSRASEYMTVSFFKVHGSVLCLSYKGRASRNIEDVHDLVFRLPTIEYRNKTWSNLDMMLQLKKDVIKALISHAGAIVGNKFAHHRPSKMQQTRLRELANTSTVLSASTLNGNGSGNDHSETTSDESTLKPEEARHRVSADASAVALELDMLKRARTPSSASSSVTSMAHAAGEPGNATSAADAEGPGPTVHGDGQQDERNQRARATSTTTTRGKHFTGLQHRLRTGSGAGGGGEGVPADETEERSRKSRLLLGGQKLLKALPHP